MSFLYPRTVAISRPNAQTGFGAQGYSGETAAAETSVVSGLPASIQLKKEGSAPDADLPGDVAKRPFYVVFIPANQVTLGTINRQDIVTDDLGIRYQVLANYWNSLGYSLLAEELEV